MEFPFFIVTHAGGPALAICSTREDAMAERAYLMRDLPSNSNYNVEKVENLVQLRAQFRRSTAHNLHEAKMLRHFQEMAMAYSRKVERLEEALEAVEKEAQDRGIFLESIA